MKEHENDDGDSLDLFKILCRKIRSETSPTIAPHRENWYNGTILGDVKINRCLKGRLRMPAQNQIDGQHADTLNIIKLLIGSDVPGVPQVE